MEKKPEPQCFFPRESFINSGQILSWQNQISKFSVTVNLPSFLYFVLVHILSNSEKLPKRWYHFPRPVQVCFIFNSLRIFCAAWSAWINFSLQLAPDFSNFNILTFFTTSRAISNPPYKWKATNFQKKNPNFNNFLEPLLRKCGFGQRQLHSLPVLCLHRLLIKFMRPSLRKKHRVNR